MITKIISGGQTGADRSALDFAIDNNIPHDGWIPKGRMTEGGQLPDKYHLQEMELPAMTKERNKMSLIPMGRLLYLMGILPADLL